MFEQSVLEARSLAARPWTLAVSLAGQSLLISTAIILPLLHPDVLHRASFWIPMVSPPHEYRPPAPARVDAVRQVTVHRQMNINGLIAPVTIPDKIAMLQDPPPEIGSYASGSGDPGVIGGLSLAGSESSIIRGIAQPSPVAPSAPPKQVVVDTPKSPAAIPRLRLGGDVQGAKLIYGPRPVYPALARQARIQGIVHLSALIGTDGRIAGLHLIDGHPLLVGAAMEAVKRWVYKPTLLNGDPVEVVTEISVTFSLQ